MIQFDDRIDARSPTPLYAQIANRVKLAIASGELRVGDGLPSVRHLASQLRVNPATVVQAYRELEAEGFVKTRHGAGTFVGEVDSGMRQRERSREARRLVRELIADAVSLGLSPNELLTALRAEIGGAE